MAHKSGRRFSELTYLKEQQALEMVQDRKLEQKTQEQYDDVINSPENCTPIRQEQEEQFGKGGATQAGNSVRNLEECY